MAPKRRPRGSGSLYQNKSGKQAGKWTCKIPLSDAATGDKRYRYFTGKSPTEAERLARTWEKENGSTGASNTTIAITVAAVAGNFVRGFEQLVESGDREYNTLEGYKLYLKKIEADPIGRMQVAKLTARDVDEMTTRMRTGYHGRRQPMSSNYVRLVRGLLSRSMPAAIKAGYVLTNPVTEARPIKHTVKPQRPLTDDEVDRLLEAAKARGPQTYALISFLVGTGVRRGEVLGLRWSDVDWDNRRAAIERQIKRNAGKGKEGKQTLATNAAAASVRRVPLSDSVVESLRAQKGAHDRKQAEDASWNSDGWVFLSGRGGHLDPDNASKEIVAVAEHAGVIGVSAHRFRHTAITKMANEDVHVSIAQRIAGHANVRTTLQVYRHVSDDDFMKAAVALDRPSKTGPQT